MNRDKIFKEIQDSISKYSHFNGNDYIIINNDSLEVLRSIPSHSIGLILTDPPYHSTKKKNITNDTAFEVDEDFLLWIEAYSKEWKRILRPNGSLFMYCSSTMSARLEILLSKEFNILSNIVWTKPNEPGFDGWKQKMKKEALRQWYAHTERIIFAEPASEGNLHRSPFASFLRQKRKEAGITAHYLAEVTGSYGKVNHGGAVSNWETGRNIPSRDQYSKIVKALLATGKVKRLPDYEEVIRPFNVNATVEFTDVWNFPSVKPYKGKHPAEKPLDMLEHAIKATTYENDIVLDCFAGSGNTAIAALNCGRKTISIEIEKDWTLSIYYKLNGLMPYKSNGNIESTIPIENELELAFTV